MLPMSLHVDAETKVSSLPQHRIVYQSCIEASFQFLQLRLGLRTIKINLNLI